MLRRFPSDRDFMTANSAESGLLMLRWQQDRGNVHTELLKGRVQRLEEEIEQLEQLEQLAKAGGVMRDLKSVRRKIDQLNDQVDMIQHDQNQIELEESELEALRHQVERALKAKESKDLNGKKED